MQVGSEHCRLNFAAVIRTWHFGVRKLGCVAVAVDPGVEFFGVEFHDFVFCGC
jgi:hypothetical protein